MSNLLQVIEELKSKTKKLVLLHSNLQTENNLLKEKINKLTQTIKQQEYNLKELEKSNAILKISKKLQQNTENAKNINLTINQLVREVDKCIALLNK